MPSTLKTTLVAGTVALIAALGAAQGAQAGGRHHIPFVPFNTHAYSNYDDEGYDSTYGYGCEDCGYESEADEAVSTAARAARSVLGVDVEEVLDYVGE